MIISGSAEAVERRTLVQNIQALQWRVTTLDEEIDATRQSLLLFEASYQQTMEPFSEKHAQLDKVLRRLTQTIQKLNHPPQAVPASAQRPYVIRPSLKSPHTVAEANTKIPHIRDLFRSLARQYHPDLATNEDDRIIRSSVMARVNDAYNQRDLARLLQIQDRMASVNADSDLHHLRSRHAYLQNIEAQLLQEMEILLQCPIAQLRDKITEASQRGINLLPLIQKDMEHEFHQRLPWVQSSAYELEQTAKIGHNENTQSPILTTQKSYINHRILDKIIDLANASPNTVFLLLIAHFFNESPDALSGLAYYDAIEMRLQAISTSRTSLAACLVDAEAWVSFDVIKHYRARTGLVIRDPVVATAMSHLIAHPDAAAWVRRVLRVMGDMQPCTRCKRNVFTIPLLLLRGLDSLRALACSLCGHWIHMYWLPCGEDIASHFWPIYLQQGLLHEVPMVLGDIKIGIQLAPAQYTRWTVAQFLDAVVHHVFVRNNITLKREHLILMHNKNSVDSNTPIKKLTGDDIVLSINPSNSIDLDVLMEKVKEAITGRFQTLG